MSKYYSLLGGTTTDTEIQVVQENRTIIGFGPYMLQDRYVIFQIEHTANGYLYHLVNLDTREIRRTDILEPLSTKYGIGLYYDDVNHEQMDTMEVSALASEAKEMGTKIEEIGKLIRKERINLGLTQEELSQKVEVGKTQISKIENGRDHGSRP